MKNFKINILYIKNRQKTCICVLVQQYYLKKQILVEVVSRKTALPTYQTKPWAPPPLGSKFRYRSGTQNSVSPKICWLNPGRMLFDIVHNKKLRKKKPKQNQKIKISSSQFNTNPKKHKMHSNVQIN